MSNDPSVKARFVNGPGPCIDYEWINTQKVTDPDIRKAISLAINRQGIQTAYGGALFGSLVDTIIPASIAGSSPPDLGLKPTGDVAGAKALLQGKTVPTIVYDVCRHLGQAEGRCHSDPERPEGSRHHDDDHPDPGIVVLHDDP